ncbi:ATP-binding cassette domain-containing protein [Lactiplantibacillus mudanjiangensis]|uniref:ABC transporter ATP-binding protein [Lactobacillus sp.] n=1 Tax=Lactiplantibacillus mudanjiangensis TaxID=1296538 RepID=A0A660DXN4_9LACO|nr:ATP-binding cassette domain-containing protein [Lactiplantibacillus mudanjiangensis]VDG24940.1 ABC transporter ATP-binding protein [Lactobacillus sp.] [Lactiplantibacillus mudanjiangensis]VDG28177.1 ABC transporter ATP-binding protein [Lactobacillus sp.] [Lactiplantibacillus mudanjiangensis]
MQLKSVSYTFPRAKTPFFENLNLDLPEHQVNFLIGQNGAGKTTLADILLGLRPVTGEITPKLSTLYLNQKLPMLPAIRVCDVAALVLGVATGHVKLSLNDLEDLVDAPTLTFLTPIWEKHYSDLSGGQQKLVQLLLFLQVDRDLVVLDEPTAFIDRQHVATLFKVIKAHPQRTYLMITHDVRDIEAFEQYRVFWLADRQIKQSWDQTTFADAANEAEFLQNFQTV